MLLKTFPDGQYVYKLQPSALRAIAKHLSNSNVADGYEPTRPDSDSSGNGNNSSSSSSSAGSGSGGTSANENESTTIGEKKSNIIRNESFKVVYDFNASF